MNVCVEEGCHKPYLHWKMSSRKHYVNLLRRPYTMNWGHILLLLLLGRGTQRFVCVCFSFEGVFLTFISKFRFGQSIWDKSVMLLRMSSGTLWDLGGNLLEIWWESSVNTLGTTTKQNLFPQQNPKEKNWALLHACWAFSLLTTWKLWS
jgi:hypothetical protein